MQLLDERGMEVYRIKSGSAASSVGPDGAAAGGRSESTTQAKTLQMAVESRPSSGYVDNTASSMQFAFDRVLDPSTTQDDTYSCCAAPIVQQFLAGYNGSVFAFGQTASGKTHTICGDEGAPYRERGIIPRVLGDVFRYMDEHPELSCKVLMSYLEVYQEGVYDLLDTGHATGA